MAIKINFEDLKDSNTTVVLRDNQTPEQFYTVLEKTIKSDKLPVNLCKETIKSGGFLSSKHEEMILLKCSTPENDEVTISVSAKIFGKFLIISAYLLNNCKDNNAIRVSFINVCWGAVGASISKAFNDLSMQKFDKGFLGIS